MKLPISSSIVRSFLVFITILSSTACSNERSKPVEQKVIETPVLKLDIDQIKERGYITAIIDNSSTGLFLYKGKTMGYEYELLQLYAQEIGVNLRMNITADLEEGFRKLEAGEGDILAYNLTVTKERKKRIAFTDYHNLVKSVLIQRKPNNWRDMKLHEIEKTMIRNPVELIDKQVHVRHHSSFVERLENLSEEIGGDILIIHGDPSIETEGLIRKVAEGKIDFTVAEEDVALVNSTYYANLDIKTAVSFPQQIAWGVRKNGPDLLSSLNDWIAKMKKTADYYVIYDKYFKSTKSALRRAKSDYFSISSDELSPYDRIIKKYAIEIGWDWRLLAAQIFKESKFDKNAKSWAGAVGLMQLLPVTASEYGVEDLTNPEDNLLAGTEHLKWLQNYWEDKVDDPVERQKFILASYNVGHGHVMDAIRLTKKYDGNPQVWSEEVEAFLLKKSNSNYFNDEVVQYGYCRGLEPVTYVKVIYETYENYKVLVPNDSTAKSSGPES
ncbi:MAG: transporter substrate-binding domain-containing protein [Cyclobacteriaceae bacterium]